MSLFGDMDDTAPENDDTAALQREESEGLQLPRASSLSIGHGSTERHLRTMVEEDRVPHAMIFAGPQGIGKATMAFRFARYLLAKGGASQETADGGLFGDDLPVDETTQNLAVEETDPVFRQVAAGGHPDLITVERPVDEKTGKTRDQVDVFSVRKLVSHMQMTASQRGWRVAIVDDADTMNRNAQNAILKVLEEPPANALLILVAHRPGVFLPTIRSRCRKIAFKPLDEDSFAALIERDRPALSQHDIGTLYQITGGSPGRALQLADEGGLESVANVTALLQQWPRWDWPQIHGLADTLGRAGSAGSLRAFRDVMIWVFEAILRFKAGQGGLPPLLDNEDIRALAAHFSLQTWINIYSDQDAHFERIERANLDDRQAVLGVFTILNQQAESTGGRVNHG